MTDCFPTKIIIVLGMLGGGASLIVLYGHTQWVHVMPYQCLHPRKPNDPQTNAWQAEKLSVQHDLHELRIPSLMNSTKIQVDRHMPQPSKEGNTLGLSGPSIVILFILFILSVAFRFFENFQLTRLTEKKSGSGKLPWKVFVARLPGPSSPSTP